MQLFSIFVFISYFTISFIYVLVIPMFPIMSLYKTDMMSLRIEKNPRKTNITLCTIQE